MTYYYPNSYPSQYQSNVPNEQISNGQTQIYCFSTPATTNEQQLVSDPAKYQPSNLREFESFGGKDKVNTPIATGRSKNIVYSIFLFTLKYIILYKLYKLIFSNIFRM